MDEAKTRPGGILAVAVLMALSGVLTMLSNVPSITGIHLPSWMIALNVAVGIAMFAVAWGLFTLKPWAWVVTLGIQAVNGLFAIVAVVSNRASPAVWSAALSILVSAGILYYLTRPAVRFAFGVGAGSTRPV